MMTPTTLIAVGGWLSDAGCLAPLAAALPAGGHFLPIDEIPRNSNLEHDVQLDQATCGRDNYLLAGWSLGALRCLAGLVRNPAGCRGLLLFAPTARLTADGPRYPGVSPALLRAMRQRLFSDTAGCVSDFLRQCHQPGKPAGLERQVSSIMARWSPLAMARGLDILARTDLRAKIKNPGLPIAIFHGLSDAVVPPFQGKWLSRHLPGSVFCPDPDCGHLPGRAMLQTATGLTAKMATGEPLGLQPVTEIDPGKATVR